ncbi:hypothetical protein EON63_11985 [archaeon]|nr:MAG: hypothetical protein EON63_11985 [archaeon]
MLRFLLLGDWGKASSNNKQQDGKNDKNDKSDNKKSSSYQEDLANAMADHAELTYPHPSFVLALGDNFYNDGVSSPEDPLWNTLWKNIYLKNHTFLRLPWYPVLGNHDYGGGNGYALAQIQRTYEHTDDNSWQFFDTHYTIRYSIPNSHGHVQLVFVDTTTLAPSKNKCCNEEG